MCSSCGNPAFRGSLLAPSQLCDLKLPPTVCSFDNRWVFQYTLLTPSAVLSFSSEMCPGSIAALSRVVCKDEGSSA